MANSFKYTFVNSDISWEIGLHHHSLSFSADGKTLAVAKAHQSSTEYGGIRFLDVNSGASRGSQNLWEMAVFSPTQSDTVLLKFGRKEAMIMKQDPPGATSWKESPSRVIGDQGTFRLDGMRITSIKINNDVGEWDSSLASTIETNSITFPPNSTKASSVTYSPDNLLLIGFETGQLTIRDYESINTLIQLAPVGFKKISACAWSANGQWIATGDDDGDTRLWNASNRIKIALVKLIPRNNLSPILSLIFVPDSTALIILGGDYLRVWDIGKGAFVDNGAGLLPAGYGKKHHFR